MTRGRPLILTCNAESVVEAGAKKRKATSGCHVRTQELVE